MTVLFNTRFSSAKLLAPAVMLLSPGQPSIILGFSVN